ncbi:hypothetical protein, partial [Tannerella sp.]|uniref:hypothetical protein n=1 Tax=Tannerella sp. TaxID=2382127 RepID=UPI003FA1D271
AKVGTFYLLGQVCALPTELLPRCFLLHSQSAGVAFFLPRLEPFIFWGKFVLYQLNYFRVIATSAKCGCKDR